MKTEMREGERESIVRLRADLLTARVLVWIARTRQDADITPEAHIYLFDRYYRLAAYHRRRGHQVRAARLQAKADEHLVLGGGDGPPYAAAMGMPRPRAWFVTQAVSPHATNGPRDAA